MKGARTNYKLTKRKKSRGQTAKVLTVMRLLLTLYHRL